MAALPQGSGEVVLISNAGGPPSGCMICGKHRRIDSESTSNGTVCFARIKGGVGGEICGACGAILKALFP
jgi:hypothetical protein